MPVESLILKHFTKVYASDKKQFLIQVVTVSVEASVVKKKETERPADNVRERVRKIYI